LFFLSLVSDKNPDYEAVARMERFEKGSGHGLLKLAAFPPSGQLLSCPPYAQCTLPFSNLPQVHKAQSQGLYRKERAKGTPRELLFDYGAVTTWMCPVLIRLCARQEDQETVMNLASPATHRLPCLQAKDKELFLFLRRFGVVRPTEGHRGCGPHRRYPFQEVSA
jgi:hypothetical protein